MDGFGFVLYDADVWDLERLCGMVAVYNYNGLPISALGQGYGTYVALVIS